VPSVAVRWSDAEARKPYARPYMVTFSDDAGSAAGNIAVSGADLLYYHQFQAAVLALGGELFRDPQVEAAADTQRAWLDRVAEMLPAINDFSVRPLSAFDDHHGRVFHLEVRCDGGRMATVDAATLFEYQEFQAAVAHQAGCLYRNSAVESVADVQHRRATWAEQLRDRLARPSPDEAMTGIWPWR
jgi:hypothetical protein